MGATQVAKLSCSISRAGFQQPKAGQADIVLLSLTNGGNDRVAIIGVFAGRARNDTPTAIDPRIHRRLDSSIQAIEIWIPMIARKGCSGDFRASGGSCGPAGMVRLDCERDLVSGEWFRSEADVRKANLTLFLVCRAEPPRAIPQFADKYDPYRRKPLCGFRPANFASRPLGHWCILLGPGLRSYEAELRVESNLSQSWVFPLSGYLLPTCPAVDVKIECQYMPSSCVIIVS